MQKDCLGCGGDATCNSGASDYNSAVAAGRRLAEGSTSVVAPKGAKDERRQLQLSTFPAPPPPPVTLPIVKRYCGQKNNINRAWTVQMVYERDSDL